MLSSLPCCPWPGHFQMGWSRWSHASTLLLTCLTSVSVFNYRRCNSSCYDQLNYSTRQNSKKVCSAIRSFIHDFQLHGYQMILVEELHTGNIQVKKSLKRKMRNLTLISALYVFHFSSGKSSLQRLEALLLTKQFRIHFSDLFSSLLTSVPQRKI